MKTFGQIYLKQNKIMIDAEPHIMSRARNIFADVESQITNGKFTHKVIVINPNGSNCRDVVWLADRFKFEFIDNSFAFIKNKSDEYEEMLRAVSDADSDNTMRISADSLVPFLDFRDHQVRFINMALKVKRLLLADFMGLGKTISAIGTCLNPSARPALVICPPHICTQWEREIKRVLPDASTHVIKGFSTYAMPFVDFIITSYNRLKPWEDEILRPDIKFPTVIMDEVHEVRKTGTDKRKYAKLLSQRADNVFGLSGTPIFNYGIEIWSVLDVLSPNALGTENEFSREWCNYSTVREPAVLSSYLKNQGLMLRRTPEQVGLSALGSPSKHVFTLDSDLDSIQEIQDIAKKLALSILSGRVGETSQSEREFDHKLRHATGVAKAKSSAEFVKMLCDQGEKVVLCAWHRDCYDIILKKLSAYQPVMFTGSETANEKSVAVERFINDPECKVFVISLRSGAGIDGLQFVSNNIVFAELDWSPHVMDQLVARLDRDGQRNHVNAYYLTINDGSDPFIMNVLNLKRSQHDGVVDSKISEATIVDHQQDGSRVRDMARAYLQAAGEAIPEAVPEVGLLGETARLLRSVKVSTNSEEEMQEGLWQILPSRLQGRVEREVTVGKKSRLDFLVSNENERIAIECKKTQGDRQAVYRQVRRYVEEAKVTAVILFAPWFGVGSFIVDEIPVIVVDFTKNSI